MSASGGERGNHRDIRKGAVGGRGELEGAEGSGGGLGGAL
jgi:hypothetical protein